MSLNSDFGAALLNADLPPPAQISDGHGGPAEKRFNVYRNNVAVSLSDALEAAFPVVRSLVGEEFFRALAGVALRQFPPRTPLMAEYGQDMPSFLDAFPPVAQLPYLADVARIENAVRRAYHARDAFAFSAEDLGQMDPEKLGELRFELAPSVTVIRSNFPVGTIWLNNQPDVAPRKPTAAEDVLISRPGFDPRVDILPVGAAVFLAMMDGTRSLNAALEQVPDTFDFSETLPLCLSRGVLVLKEEEDQK